MIKKITSVVTLSLILSASLYAKDVNLQDLPAKDAQILKTIKDKLQTTFSQLNVQDFRESPIPGIYEIVTTNQVMYYYPEKSYMIFGQIYSEDGRSLTEESKSRIQIKKIKDVDISTALVIGHGKKEIIEFTDLSCPYCKKLHHFLEDKGDEVTRKIIFSPITQLHPDAIQKSVHVMCSKDKEKAMSEIMNQGVAFLDMKVCEEGKKIVREHMRISNAFGVEGTPTVILGSSVVQGFDLNRIKTYLEQEPIKNNRP